MKNKQVGGTAVHVMKPHELDHVHPRQYPPGPNLSSLLDASGPLLTDWISCTTPPVREGEYALKLAGDQRTEDIDKPNAEFVGGVWYWLGSGDKCHSPNNWPPRWEYRGVRRWVLEVQVPSKPATVTGIGDVDVVPISYEIYYLSNDRAGPEKRCFNPHLENAIGFTTQAAAEKFAVEHFIAIGAKAVLP